MKLRLTRFSEHTARQRAGTLLVWSCQHTSKTITFRNITYYSILIATEQKVIFFRASRKILTL